MLSRFFGLLSADLAIDLGTANTLVGLPGEGLVLNEPSVVAVARGGNRMLADGSAVGHLARQMLGRSPDSIAVVRPLREGVIADFHLCEAMLRYFLRKARPGRFAPRPRVLVGVPGSISPVEKRAVCNSVQRAGARQVLLVPQAKAAAIGAGLPLGEAVGSMVVDIGAGVTEVAVMSLSDRVAGRTLRVGGDAMDRSVTDYVRRRFGLRIGPAAAEQLRIDAGCAYPLDEPRIEELTGIDAASGLPRRVTITSEDIREALADPLEQIVDAIRETLDGCQPDLAADLVAGGMALTGGGALLRSLDRFLTERTGIPARVATDPQEAVARGALACLENLESWRTALESSDDDL